LGHFFHLAFGPKAMKDLLHCLSRWSLEQLHHFAPQQLAGVAWACGKTNTGSLVLGASMP
jgi:hypothetical protein